MIRKKGIIAVLVTALVLALLGMFLMNPILKMTMTSSLETVLKAKVEIGSVKLDVFKPSFSIYKMKAGDRSKEFNNLFELEKAEFGFNLEAALMKKIVVEEAVIAGFKTGTERKSSGFLSAARIKQIEKNEKNSVFGKLAGGIKGKAENEIKKLPVAKAADTAKDLKNMDIKKLASPDQLESYRLLKEGAPVLEEKKKTALASVENAKIDEKTAAVKKAAEELKAIKINGIADAPKAQEALAKLETIRKEAQAAQDAFNKAKSDATDFYDYGKTLTANVNDARNRDTEKIMEKLDIGAVSSDGIIKALVGPVWYERVTGTLALLHTAEKYMPAGLKKKNKQPLEKKRLHGRDIIFPGGRDYPTLLVKKMVFTTGKENESGVFSGKAEWITTEQYLTGEPTTFNIGSSGAGSLRVSGKIDHIEEINDELTVMMAGMSVKNGGVGAVDAGNITMIPGASDYKATAYNRAGIISLNADIGLRQIEFTAKDKSDIVLEALKGIDELNAKVILKGKADGFDMSVTTDAAERISRNISKIYGEKLAKAKKQINDEVGKAIAGENSNVSKVISGGNKEIEGKLAVYEKKIKDALSGVDKAKAEINKKLASAQQEGGKKLLKGLFGK